MESNEEKNCQISRWQLLKGVLNNLKPAEFKQRLEASSTPIIIDVRTSEEFEAQHIEGAINISYFAEDLWQALTKFSKEDTFFIYCRTGRRSIRVCTLMKNGGFDNDKLFNLDGGLVAWNETFQLEPSEIK